MGTFIDTLRTRNEPLFYFGLICLLGAFGCLLLTRITHTELWGTSAWYKPFKFFLSTAVFLWSMAWYMQNLGSTKAVLWYSWGMIVIFTFEDVYIALQAGRAQLSHFNVSSSFYAGMYGLMAVASVAISVWTTYIGILFFQRTFPEFPETYLWGIRLGIFLFVLFSLEGLAMGSQLTHTIGGADGSPGLPIVNWSRQYGDLRIAHFVGMHALQVIPILSYYAVKSVRGVFVIGLVYGIIAAALFVQALLGRPLFKY